MAGTTQVFVASTLYGVVCLAAAIDNDSFDDAGERHLVITNNATIPEIVPSVTQMSGFELLAKRFDHVHDYNETLAPFHPASWAPRPIDGPLWQRYLRMAWGLGSDTDLQLVVESIQVDPAQSLCRIFGDARIEVYADGLMSYGPTRSDLHPTIGSRVERLLYPDLVPQIRPLLLAEWEVITEVIPAESITRTLAEISGETVLGEIGASVDDGPVAVLLGQYLSPLGILTADEEAELHRQMLSAAIAEGHRRVIFKPHPSAPRTLADSLTETARAHDVRLWVLTEAALAETLYEQLPVGAVFGCFSTAMLTAARLYHIPVARVGTELVLQRLTPYHNSNRIPLTLVDALLPTVGTTTLPAIDDTGEFRDDLGPLASLITAVGFVMQPQRLADRRAEVEAFLAGHVELYSRYFNRRRLTKLGLPGALPPKQRRPAAAPNRLRTVRRRLGRAWRHVLQLSDRLAPRRTGARRPRRPE